MATATAKKNGLLQQMGFGDAKPLQMGLMGLLGYLLGPGINSSGLPIAAYNAVPTYHKFVDTMYNAFEQSGALGNNPWSQGGGSGVMKIVGGVMAAKAGYDSYEAGRIKGRDMNVSFPFAIGAILDPPQSKGQGYVSEVPQGGAGQGGGMGGWI